MIALALLIPVGVVGGMVALVFFLVRGNRADEVFSSRTLLRAYLRFAYMAGLVVFLIGAVSALTAGLAALVGHDYSYVSNVNYASPCVPPGPGIDQGGFKQCVTRFQPPADTHQQDDLIRGLSLMVTGLLLGAGHRVGQRMMESEEERRQSGQARTEALLGTVGFGLVAIVALPLATFSVLHRAILGAQASAGSPDTPGPALAVALVFLPAWLFYLFLFVTRSRARPLPGAAASG